MIASIEQGTNGLFTATVWDAIFPYNPDDQDKREAVESARYDQKQVFVAAADTADEARTAIENAGYLVDSQFGQYWERSYSRRSLQTASVVYVKSADKRDS